MKKEKFYKKYQELSDRYLELTHESLCHIKCRYSHQNWSPEDLIERAKEDLEEKIHFSEHFVADTIGVFYMVEVSDAFETLQERLNARNELFEMYKFFCEVKIESDDN